MDILGQFWWVVVVVANFIVMIVLLSRKKSKKQATIIQHQRDESIILNVYNKMNSHEIREYMALPSRDSRLAWLKLNHPEVMEAVGRRYSESDYDFVIASNLDMRLLRDETTDRKTAIRNYRNTAVAMSMNEYQLILDKKNADYRKRIEARAKAEAQRRAEAAAAQAAQQKAANKYWNSLTKEQKAAFKQARGATARKRVLPATSDYSTDALYPLIMATQFNSINCNTTQSIDYCESSSHGHSSGHHSDGGSHSYDGGGGGHSDGGGSSGGDGGGGGGE